MSWPLVCGIQDESLLMHFITSFVPIGPTVCRADIYLHEADNFSFQILKLSSVEAIYSRSRAEDA